MPRRCRVRRSRRRHLPVHVQHGSGLRVVPRHGLDLPRRRKEERPEHDGEGMSRLALLVVLAGTAYADDDVDTTIDPDAIPDQSLGASLGIAGGGRVTVGGFRVQGHYLYQLSDQDWFDGTAAF